VGEAWKNGDGEGERVLTYQAGTRLLSIEDRSTGSFTDLIYLDGRLIAEGRGDRLNGCHLDHLGTPRFLTDQDGKVIGRLDLGPFGEPLNQSGEMPVLGFGGHRPLHGLELLDMKCRTYSVAWSRFIEPDRVDDAKQWNLYAYAAGNPLFLIDGGGQTSELAWLFSSSFYLKFLEYISGLNVGFQSMKPAVQITKMDPVVIRLNGDAVNRTAGVPLGYVLRGNAGFYERAKNGYRIGDLVLQGDVIRSQGQLSFGIVGPGAGFSSDAISREVGFQIGFYHKGRRIMLPGVAIGLGIGAGLTIGKSNSETGILNIKVGILGFTILSPSVY